jgi:hypothetical protein
MTAETITFAGDESGDVSYPFGKGASRHFVVAVIGTAQKQAVRQALAEARHALNLPDDYEFDFNIVTVFGRDSRGDADAYDFIATKLRRVVEYQSK